jgi:hypothetical protein
VEDQARALHTLSIAPWLLRGGQWGGWGGNMSAHFRTVASGGRCGLPAPMSSTVINGPSQEIWPQFLRSTQ